MSFLTEMNTLLYEDDHDLDIEGKLYMAIESEKLDDYDFDMEGEVFQDIPLSVLEGFGLTEAELIYWEKKRKFSFSSMNFNILKMGDKNWNFFMISITIQSSSSQAPPL